MDANIQRGKNYIAIPPGETIKEQLQNRGLTQREFAERMDFSDKHISRLINGYVELNTNVALRLETVLGLPASFWLNLEANYRENLERVKNEKEMEADFETLKLFPYPEMAKCGWVKSAKTKEEKVAELRRFFEVARLYSIDKLAIPGIAYRKTGEGQKSDYVLAAWAQAARLKARAVKTPEINIAKLKEKIPEIRRLTIQSPDIFCESLKKILFDCGTVVIFLPHLKGSYLHGASFIDSSHIVIGLTVRGRDADRFWFSLFHELGHIINGDVFTSLSTDEQEAGADAFARDTLIPQREFDNFCNKKDFSAVAIQQFASGIDISQGIVVGRLQKEGYLPFNCLNYLKERYVIM